MINFKTVNEFLSDENQKTFQALNSFYGMNFVAVFDIQQNLIALYVCKSILVQDEQNRKTFLIKGKLVNNLGALLQQGGGISSIMNGSNSGIKQVIESLPDCIHTYSDNMFGFIGIGIQGY